MRDGGPGVIIVGAGPVGLCLGLHLAQAGVPFVILEEHAGLSSELKDGTILPSSLEIFAWLGIAETLMGAGANLTQADLERVLFEALSERGRGGSVRFGCTVTGVEQDSDGCTVTIDHPKGPEQLRGTYVIGCDGAGSPIRKAAGIELVGRTYPESFSVFNFRVPSFADTGRAPIGFVHGADEWLLLVRLPECWRVVWPVAPDQPVPSAADLQTRVTFAFGEPPVELVGQALYRVHHRYAERFRVGRIFLAGDAAHFMTPLGGLGLCTGLQDVSNLAWKLARVLQGTADEALLDGYEQERLPVARLIASQVADGRLSTLVSSPPNLNGNVGNLQDDRARIPH